MNTDRLAAKSNKRSWSTRLFQSQLLKVLNGLEETHLQITDGDQQWSFGEPQADPAQTLSTTITIHHPDFYGCSLLGGSVGAGEAYMDGLWDCSDLTALVRSMVRNRDTLDSLDSGWARLTMPALKWLHRRNRNTHQGSRRNIAAHYDLGNDLFELFLDENMMYSAAAYQNDDDRLETASDHKLERICRKLTLTDKDHLLEIGTGWGGLAIYAARNYGCRVTTTTISKEQHDLAATRIREAGLEDQITLLLKDYRDLQGHYDKLVSVEMIEAVGHQYVDTYFKTCSNLLKPKGMMLLQAITIEDHRYEMAVNSIDFIKRYIFPGSFIPSISVIAGAIAKNTDMTLFHLEDIGQSYAKTLREWRKRFNANLSKVRELGYPERFIRMWEYYLCYCEGGFLERSISDVQMLFTKPRAQRSEILPQLEPIL